MSDEFYVLSWIQICLWGQYLCISPTRIQRTQSEVVADKRLICSSALSAINASSRFVIHFSVRVTFLPRVLTDGSTFFSIFSCTFCSTFFSSVLRECFFTHFFQYFFDYFSEYSPARVLFLVLFRVLFWVISCESTFWSIFFSFFSLLSAQLLLPRLLAPVDQKDRGTSNTIRTLLYQHYANRHNCDIILLDMFQTQFTNKYDMYRVHLVFWPLSFGIKEALKNLRFFLDLCPK